MNHQKPYWITSFLIVTITLLAVVYYLNTLPERVPIHFNGAGEPDRFGTKTDLFILPVLNLGLAALLYYMSKKMVKIDPHKIGAKTEEQLAITRLFLSQMSVFISLLFLVLTYQSIRVALEQSEGIGRWMVPLTLLGPIFLVMIYLIKISRLPNKTK